MTAIENTHNKGLIHRDIKPSNFAVGIGKDKNKVFLIDFGISKVYMNQDGSLIPPRSNTEFRGTISYASLNAHNRIVKILGLIQNVGFI